MKFMTGFCAAAGLVFATAATAQGLPAITLKCSGASIEEARSMTAERSSHALTISFSTRGGLFITSAKTQVLDLLTRVAASSSSCGPVGQVDVTKPGRYRVSAILDGVVVDKMVELRPAGGESIVLLWPDVR